MSRSSFFTYQLSRRKLLRNTVLGVLSTTAGAGLYALTSRLFHTQSLTSGAFTVDTTAATFSGQRSGLPTDIVVYSAGIAPGWQNWSWAKSAEIVFEGWQARTFVLEDWKGLYFHHEPQAIGDYDELHLTLNGGAGSGQRILVCLVDTGGQYLTKVKLSGNIGAHIWKRTSIPLPTLLSEETVISGVILQADGAEKQPGVYLSDLRFVASPSGQARLLAVSAENLSTIALQFSRSMSSDVRMAANFRISSADDAYYSIGKQPESVTYNESTLKATLHLSHPLRNEVMYSLDVRQVHDSRGNVLASTTTVSFVPKTITLTVDATHKTHPISPYIYGISSASDKYLKVLRPKLHRWGGNSTSRYNWKLGNAFSAARDYGFRNGSYNNDSESDRKPSGVADKFILATKKSGAAALITIPTIGFVARDADLQTFSVHVPAAGGPPVAPGSQAIVGYDPTENRQRTCVVSAARKGQPFNDPPAVAEPTVYQDEWVYHLKKRFGSAQDGGVRFYAMDNEPDLWPYTHTDIHPAQPSYEDMLHTFLDYATAVKDVDVSAQVTGPVSWGWTNYFYSPLDRGKDEYHSHLDRKAHGDKPFLAWWLQNIQAHDQAHGSRTLDVLDIHYYPQGEGIYSENNSTEVQKLRLRSTRSLWDSSYIDESWIHKPVELIPRMQRFIDENYPGTKLGISEWNWGAEDHMSGALAVAEVLGIFGREGVYLASYWAYPKENSPAYFAFKLFTNYDDQGGTFGDTSVKAISSDSETLSCYASWDSRRHALLLLVINKSPQHDLSPTIQLRGVMSSKAEVFRYAQANSRAIVRLPDAEVGQESLVFSFPAYSLTLFRFSS